MPKARPAGQRFLPAAIILLWVTVSLVAYYAYHRPFTPSFALLVANAIFELGCLALIVACAGGIGRRLIPRLQTAPLARFAIRCALGLGMMSLGYLLVGSTLGTNFFLAWGLLLGLLVLLRTDISAWFSDLANLRNLWKSSDNIGRAIGWLCLAIFGLELFKALAPPTGFDSLVYHLTLPKIYLSQGEISYVAENTFSGYPQLAESLTTWLGALGANKGALIGWVAGAAAILGMLGHISARLGQRQAWVAAASLLCSASLAGALSSAYVDWPSILMGWGTILFLDLWAAKRNLNTITLAGVFAGLAFGIKYTAGLLTPLGLLAILWIGGMDWRAIWRFALAALALAVPWLARNVLATGNPFYPLLLAGGEMDALRLSYYQGFAPQGNLLDVFLLPLRFTWAGVEGGRIAGAPGYEASIGPLLLILGVLAFVPFKLQKGATHLKKIAILFSIGGLAIWAIAGSLSGHLIRTQLYYALFPAFAILAAFGYAAVQRFDLAELRISRVISAVVVLVLGLNFLQIGTEVISSGTAAYWSGNLYGRDYYQINLGRFGEVMGDFSDSGNNNRRVLFLWEPRSYACAPACDPDEIIDRWPHDVAVHGSPEAAIEAWRSQGFTQVLYYRLGAKFIYDDPEHFHPFDFELMDHALSALPVVRDYDGDYYLLSLDQ